MCIRDRVWGALGEQGPGCRDTPHRAGALATAIWLAFSGVVLSTLVSECFLSIENQREETQLVVLLVPTHANALAASHSSAGLQAQDKIAVPYANGMLELAEERDNLDEVHKDLMTLQVRFAVHFQGSASK